MTSSSDPSGRHPVLERVEPRLLLSGSHPAIAVKRPVANPSARAVVMKPIVDAVVLGKKAVGATLRANYSGSSSPFGKTPAMIRNAYGLGAYGSGTVTFGGVQGDGRGQTIAIIDAYDDPTAASDLNAFSSYYGLPTLIANTSTTTIQNSAGPTFTKVSQTGSTTALPGTDPGGPYASTGQSTWEQEEALDIEWAHVMAPQANIVLVECNTASDSNLINAGANWARRQAGVDVVSMSFGTDEWSGETAEDTYFTTPSGHVGGSATLGGPGLSGGVTFVASAGDDGAFGTTSASNTTLTAQYPAASPNVVAVGGTFLSTYSDGSYASESAWGHGNSSGTSGGGGGGISAYEPQPAYQATVAAPYSTAKRTYPDLSLDADPNSGVPVYDSYDFGSSTPWVYGFEGGTSLAAPMVAGLVAVADQGRAAAGLGSLDGATQTLPRIYELSSGDYHDITTSRNGTTNANGTVDSNGYTVGTGYDLASGIGSPIAGRWVADLAGGATVAGQVFRDTNANDTLDGFDTAYAGQAVYLDLANTGTYASVDPTATTNSNGSYSFTDVVGGLTATVRLRTALNNVTQVATSTVNTAYATAANSVNVAEFPTLYSDATAGDNWTLRASPNNAAQFQVLQNGTVAYTAPVSLPSSLSFSFTGSNDGLSVDFGSGVPVPAGGVSVNGGSAGNNAALSVLGTAGNDAITVNAAAVTFASSTINFSNVANLSVEPRGGTDSLTVNAGTITLPAQAAGGGFLARTFSALTVAAGAKLVVGTAAARSDRSVLVLTAANGLSIAATARLDLGGNDVIVRNGTLSTVAGLVATGYAGGAWTGAGGLASGAAAANTARTTALGVIQASAAANTSTFDGQSISASDVLVKYTYVGDTNLDGSVDITDYTRIDLGYVGHGTGWANGDFNYDGVVDGSDYTLIDNAYRNQSATL